MNFISGILSSFIVYLDDNFFVCHSSYLALLYFWSRVYLYFFGLFLTFHSSFASFFTLFIPLLSVLKYFFYTFSSLFTFPSAPSPFSYVQGHPTAQGRFFTREGEAEARGRPRPALSWRRRRDPASAPHTPQLSRDSL